MTVFQFIEGTKTPCYFDEMPGQKKILIVLPLKPEFDAFIRFFKEKGQLFEASDGTKKLLKCEQLGLYAAQSGHGKKQTERTTRHFLDSFGFFDAVICAGTAGSLVNDLRPGDIVLGSETVEFDAKLLTDHIGSVLPHYEGDSTLIGGIFKAVEGRSDFKVIKAGIASGDEDILDHVRAEEIRKATGCSVAAWEGAGCASACRLTKSSFLEIRGVTDFADKNTKEVFFHNLESSIRNLASVVMDWLVKMNPRTSV
jgi:adenosylhomocysteine nucleosidase